MLSGIAAFNASFLYDLTNNENRVSKENQQISSGYRVSVASDDPSAVGPILEYQGQLDQVTQIQSNLTLANADVTTADQALQNASTLLDELVSIGTEGASSTTSDASRAALAQRVQNIQQQLVSIANTSSRGHYLFGGDASTTAPYTFDWTQPGGVVNNSPGVQNTSLLRDASGNTINTGLTAQQIFDAQDSNGNTLPGNIFQAVYSLGQALQNNNESAIQTAADSIKVGVTQLAQSTSTYGSLENWISQASAQASQRISALQQSLSAVRDTDVAAAATQLTLDQTAMQASLSAHGSLNTKSLFSYLG